MQRTYTWLGTALLLALALASVTLYEEGNTRIAGLKLVAQWLAPDETPATADALRSELATLRQQVGDVAVLQQQLQSVTQQVEHAQGADALTEADRLGILDDVTRSRPGLRVSAIQRMGIALVAEARRNNLDPLLLAALARIESGYNPWATSGHGALGLLQLTPVTGRTLSQLRGERLGEDEELYDIETNVALGAQYLSKLLRQFRSVDAALLAYNRGIGGAKSLLSTPERGRYLRGYPKAVMKERQRLAALAARRQDTSDARM